MGREKTASGSLARRKRKKTMTSLRGMLSLMAGAHGDKPPYHSPDAWQFTSANADEDEHDTHGESAHNDAGTRDLADGASIEMTHERARELLLRQSGELLPAAEANALADHLLTCDACYRFAQDVAARQHRQPTP